MRLRKRIKKRLRVLTVSMLSIFDRLAALASPGLTTGPKVSIADPHPTASSTSCSGLISLATVTCLLLALSPSHGSERRPGRPRFAAEGPERSEGGPQPEPRRPLWAESGPRTDELREDGRGPQPCPSQSDYPKAPQLALSRRKAFCITSSSTSCLGLIS